MRLSVVCLCFHVVGDMGPLTPKGLFSKSCSQAKWEKANKIWSQSPGKGFWFSGPGFCTSNAQTQSLAVADCSGFHSQHCNVPTLSLASSLSLSFPQSWFLPLLRGGGLSLFSQHITRGKQPENTVCLNYSVWLCVTNSFYRLCSRGVGIQDVHWHTSCDI